MQLLRKSLSAISMHLMIRGHSSRMSLFMSMFDRIRLACTKTFNVKHLAALLLFPTNNVGKMTPSPPSPTLSPNRSLSPSSATTLGKPKDTKHGLSNLCTTNKSQLIQLGYLFNKFYFDGK